MRSCRNLFWPYDRFLLRSATLSSVIFARIYPNWGGCLQCGVHSLRVPTLLGQDALRHKGRVINKYGDWKLPKSWFTQIIIAIVYVCSSVHAKAVDPIAEKNHKLLESILNLPEDQIDLAVVKLTVDHMIEPTIDVAATLRKIDVMAKEVGVSFRYAQNEWDKVQFLREYVYKPGPWNDNVPYQYDLDDPSGRKLENKSLAAYLTNKKGNCVSMPILFVILGQKVGLDIGMARAPMHYLAKYRSADGELHNFETTNIGETASLADYQKIFPMSALAIKNGLYLRYLSKRETAAEMMVTLMEYYSSKQQAENKIALAKMVLKYFPQNVSTMLNLGNGHFEIVRRDVLSKYKTEEKIPKSERPRAAELIKEFNFWYDKAESLGWRRPSQEDEDKYMKYIQKVKSERNAARS